VQRRTLLEQYRESLGSQLETPLGLKALAWGFLKTARRHRLACVARYSDVTVARNIVSWNYQFLAGREFWMKLLIHLDSYSNALGLPCVVSRADILSWASREDGYDLNWTHVQVRRTLDALAGRKTFRMNRWFRFKPPLGEDGEIKDLPEEVAFEATLENKVLDTNNRFSVLFEKWDTGDEPTLTPDIRSVVPGPMARPTLEGTREVRKHESNAMRRRLGYPTVPVNQELVDQSYVYTKRKDLVLNLIKTVVAPLITWRANEMPNFLLASQGGPKVTLSHAPLILMEAYERWAKSVLESGLGCKPPKLLPSLGGWDVPRVWDTDPKMDQGVQLYIEQSLIQGATAPTPSEPAPPLR
jgi:hypothetical protein